MKERPILFSGLMVRALLEGRKTQTRRIIKPQPKPAKNGAVLLPYGKTETIAMFETDLADYLNCPYGKPGDRLWVKETFARNNVGCAIAGILKAKDQPQIYYRASHEGPVAWRWTPSIHMPRALSRITLEIVSVRIERLRNIQNRPLDIQAEGMPSDCPTGDITWYRNLWESINGPGSWDANPFVWVIEFRRIKP